MSSPTKGPVVTLDGPAGAGKTTTAKEVARRLGFRHLDSGALYRALTYALLRSGAPEERWRDLGVDELRALNVSLRPVEGGFEVAVGGRILDRELRSRDVTRSVSTLAALPAARDCLIELQREAGEGGSLVVDGRDMGTVVFPDAEVKVYLVADLQERARRRLRQDGSGAPGADELEAEASSIAERDERDSSRQISPLKPPKGAVEIDTTGLTFDEQVSAIVGLVRQLTLP